LYNTIKENGTNTGDWYKYKKMVLIQGISTNIRKQYSFKNSIGFKFFTTIKKQIIVTLSSR